MKLIESDPSLSEICRSVEGRLQPISYLSTVEIPVVLLEHFNELGFRVLPKNPAAYSGSRKQIWVNAKVFPSFARGAAQFALAHEIAHHAHNTGIAGSLLGAKGVHPCLIADWLATQWGFAEEMRSERMVSPGPEFCDKLSSIWDEEELARWATEWERRHRKAKVLGQNIALPKLRL
jgi:hypothetical protein